MAKKYMKLVYKDQPFIMPADASMIEYKDGQTVKENLTTLNDNLQQNNFGTAIAISGTEPYVVPQDGYIFLSCGVGAKAVAIIYGASTSNYIVTGAYGVNSREGYSSLFVRKGMRVKNADGTGNVNFVPLV